MSSVEKLLNVYEVAGVLNVAVQTVYGFVTRREIPFIKIGHSLRFDREDLKAWIVRKKYNGKI